MLFTNMISIHMVDNINSLRDRMTDSFNVKIGWWLNKYFISHVQNRQHIWYTKYNAGLFISAGLLSIPVAVRYLAD